MFASNRVIQLLLFSVSWQWYPDDSLGNVVRFQLFFNMCFSRMFRKIKEINSHPLTHLLWVIIPSVIINNGNMMKCSLIRSVIIRVIDKIEWPRSASPISSSLVLSPINQNYDKIWERNRHRLYVPIKKEQFTRRNARQQRAQTFLLLLFFYFFFIVYTYFHCFPQKHLGLIRRITMVSCLHKIDCVVYCFG